MEYIKRVANVNASAYTFDRATDAPNTSKALIYSEVAYRYLGASSETSADFIPLAAGSYYEVNASAMNGITITAQAGNLGQVAVVYY